MHRFLAAVNIFSILIFFLTGDISAADAPQAPAKAAETFYKTYVQTKASSGVPSRKRLARLKPLLSRRLFSQLSDARRAEDSYRKKTKGDSPPLMEGDLFTSLFEGASRYRVNRCDVSAGSAQCTVALEYTDPADKSVTAWNDRIFLVREGMHWRVDNIEYLGTWQFMHKGTLKDLLSQVIKDGRGNKSVIGC